MNMDKFKVNSKTGILFCIVLLDSVSGLPFQKNDDVDGKTVSDDSVNFLKENPSALLTRIRRELHDDTEDDKTSDEASAPIESRFGFHDRGRKSKSFQGAGKFPFFTNTMNGDHPHFPFHYGYQPLFGSGFLDFGAGYNGPVEGFDPWNNGHGNKYGHDYHHEFYHHHHHPGYGPNHQGVYEPSHDQGHHNGFENHPGKKPGCNSKPSSGFDRNDPSANGPWNGGFLDKGDTTTTQKTTTLPQIDIRTGDH